MPSIVKVTVPHALLMPYNQDRRIWTLVRGENSAKATVEHKLLVETLFERSRSGRISRHLPFRRLRNPIQGVPLHWGFKVTNLGKSPFPGATVKWIRIKSELTNASFEKKEEFSIPSLNPNHSHRYLLSDTITFSFDGPAWISCILQPPDSSDRINTFGRIGSEFSTNSWNDDTYVDQKLAVNQARTNRLLLALTALTALEGFIGLKAFGTWFLNAFRAFLRWSLEIIS